jgi:DNA-binding response OmpR family regulator
MGLLIGLRILVVEDEPLIAFGLADTIKQAGASVVGPASTVPQATSLISSAAIDAAVLDFYLKKETASPIAALLLADGTPFLFHTGAPAGLDQSYPGVPILTKAVRPEMLVAEIAALYYLRRVFALRHHNRNSCSAMFMASVHSDLPAASSFRASARALLASPLIRV